MKKLAVIGKPIAHSLSPIIHQNFAQQFNLEIEYTKVEVDEDDFANFVSSFFNDGGYGLNITLPYKFKALQVANEISNGAKSSTVANTLKKQDNEIISACNTDGPGLIKDLLYRHKFAVANTSILILGAGGASTGIMYSLIQNKPQKIIIANRTKVKAEELCKHYLPYAKEYQVDIQAIELNQVASHGEFDLIINTTSAGHSQELIEIADEVLLDSKFIYDLSYGEATKLFFNKLKDLKIKHYTDGLGMLIEQASLSFAYWFSEMPDTNVIYKDLKK